MRYKKKQINPYQGSTLQESVSCLPDTDQESYSLVKPTQYQTYGFEYLPSVSSCASFPCGPCRSPLTMEHSLAKQQYGSDTDVPFITFQQANEKTFTLYEPGIRPNNLTQVGQRLISDEPM